MSGQPRNKWKRKHKISGSLDEKIQQHPPDEVCWTFWPGVIVVDLAAPTPVEDPILLHEGGEPRSETERSRDLAHRSLICLAIVKKACSTLVAFFAEVSRKEMFN